MIRFIYLLLLIAGFVQSNDSSAVQLSQNGRGQVLIYPYYTVNNGLNTLYSVVNTTDQAKAISVRFQEGEFGHEVLIFNIYLGAYDVWTGALAAVDSTIAGHVGEPSVLHLTSDTSCAPFLVKNGQEFLPFLIDLDGASNDNLSRAREGYIEVIEMGVLTGEAAVAASHQGTGIPANCGLIQNDWADDGMWSLGDLENPSGGLIGSATMINVAEGLAFPYDAVALQNFWQQAGLHNEPGSLEPNLSSANSQSTVWLDSGELAIAEWANGYEAVSAVLMNTYFYNEYALDTVVNGRSEWVLTFPSKKHHTVVGADVKAPFTSVWNSQVSCDPYDIVIFDREAQLEIVTVGGVGILPPPPPPSEICYSSNVFEFLLPGTPVSVQSRVLGSNNHRSQTTPASAVTENGWANLSFVEAPQRMIPINGVGYYGLPAVGFAVQQFTTAGAGEGLLAQYGNLFNHKSEVLTDAEQ